MSDPLNNPLLLQLGKQLFMKVLTDKDYQEKILKDLYTLDAKLKKMVEEKEKKKIKDNNINKNGEQNK